MGFQFHEWEDVSVIIPAHNAEETILRALHSIATQTVRAREIIVIDDGSTDRTASLVEQEIAMEGWITPIQLIKQKKQGPSKARNKGIQQAKSEYIAFLDADDEWHPQKLTRSMQELRKNNATIIAHDVIHRYPLGHKHYIENSKKFLKHPLTKLSLFLFDNINNSTVIALKSSLVEAGGFDEASFYDSGYDLWLTVLKNPQHKMHIFKGALVTYYIQNESLSSNFLKRLACHEKYIIRHAADASPLSFFAAPFLSLIRCTLLQNKICNRAARGGEYSKVLITILRMPYALLKVAILSPVCFLPVFNRTKL